MPKDLLDAADVGPCVQHGSCHGVTEGMTGPSLAHVSGLDVALGYREAEDTIGQFLSECTEADAGGRVTRGAMRSAYDAWCEERGDSVTMSAKSFHEALMEHGVVEAKPWKSLGKTHRGWERVRLLDGHGQVDDAADLFGDEAMAN